MEKRFKIQCALLLLMFGINLNIFDASVETLTLFPAVAKVLEQRDVTLTCLNNESVVSTSSTWIRYVKGFTNLHPVISLENNNCTAKGYIASDANSYSWGCPGNNTFTLTLKNVSRARHGEKWSCEQRFLSSDTSSIFVQVLVKSVRISTANTTVTVIENSTAEFNCTTSYCRPTPTITWFLDTETGDQTDYKVIVPDSEKQENFTDDQGLTFSTNAIIFSLNRSVNGMRIFCSASNVPGKNATESDRTSLNILYPHDGPPEIQGFKNHSTYAVIENHLGNLSCSIKGGNPLPELEWKFYETNTTMVTNDQTVTNVITWLPLRDQKGSIECQSTHSIAGKASVYLNINVLYPPSLPELSINSTRVSKELNVIENSTLSITCTSDSKPTANYMWTAPESSTTIGEKLYVKNITVKARGIYSCTAGNIMISSDGDIVNGSNTASIDVNVLFPPSMPVFRFGNRSGIIIRNSIDVVVNDTFSVLCISNGNPEPEVSWKDGKRGNDLLTIMSVSEDLNKTCFATNTMNETVGVSRKESVEANLSVKVLYPPIIHPFKYFTLQGIERECSLSNLSVVENTSFSLLCTANGKPAPTYSWYGPVASPSETLVFKKVDRTMKGEYSCNAFYTMKRTIGKTERGKRTRKMQLNIMYSPKIDDIVNQTVEEGLSFNMSCPIYPGNPEYTSVRWTRNSDETEWNSTVLYLPTVKRNDDAIYSCTAYNTMTPSCENVTYGQDSTSFHLNVVYKATVRSFYVNGHSGEINQVIVNENDLLEFECNIDSNPNSSISISFNKTTLISTSDVKTLIYTYVRATCFHAGVYTCTGSNSYNNGKTSKKHLTLLVNCFPRPSPYVTILDKIYTTKMSTEILSFTATAYPIPDQSDFKWQKRKGLMWSPLRNSKNIEITTSGLRSDLVIKVVKSSDFGTYRLLIENTIGIYEQFFNISSKGPPDTPTEFKVLEGALADTRVTLEWLPGSSYGSEQHFVLQYSKNAGGELISINVTDGEGLQMSYTISGLESGTWYNVIIFAISKDGISGNKSINFQTKAIPLLPKDVEIIAESKSETGVTVQWKPGSNGGSEQTFILNYREIYDSEWTNVSILDTGRQIVKHSLCGLSKKSKYQLFLISTNMFGASLKSEIIVFQTKDSDGSVSNNDGETRFIGLLTGISASAAINMILMVVMIYLKRSRNFRGEIRGTQEASIGKSASYHSFSERSGNCVSGAYEDICYSPGQEIPKRYTPLQQKRDQVKSTLSDGKTTLYEEVQTRSSPVSAMEKNNTPPENSSVSPGISSKTERKRKTYRKPVNDKDEKCDKQHTNLTVYTNLEMLPTKSKISSK